ncbi:NB-ARC domain-containing protein [Dyadobacter endophyticus]|uniref:phosphorylase family protein n=1 Tax=Dyadobacter endophyticus TaxID=1749036 RepID=UPI003CEB4D96
MSNPPLVIILTALIEEYKAVREHLESIEKFREKDTSYEKGKFKVAGNNVATVILRECGQRSENAAQETQRAIQNFNPDYIFFVGIAGSRKPANFKVGDVIVGEKIYSYEGGKSTKDTFLARPNEEKTSYTIRESAKHLRLSEDWKSLFKGDHDTSNIKADLGVIASGEKLIEHFDSEVGKILTQHYNDAQAVEMEGYAFAKAAGRQGRASSNLQIGLIRGISDVLESENHLTEDNSVSTAGMTANVDRRPTDAKDIASKAAAAFTFAIIKDLLFEEQGVHNTSPGDEGKGPLNPQQPKPSVDPNGNSKFARRLTNMPQSVPIIGRSEYIAKIRDDMTVSKKIVSVYGIGGIGKSSFARGFIDQYSSSYDLVGWISAAGMTVREAFVGTIYFDETLLEHQKEGDTVEERFQSIMRGFAKLNQRGLLVLDNVEDDIISVKDLLPMPPQWDVIITGRNRLPFREHALSELNASDAEVAFTFYFGQEIEKSEKGTLDELLKTISYHPLTIELIAKTLRESDNALSLKEVLEKLKGQNLDHQRMQEIVSVFHWNDDSATLFRHLIATFDISSLDYNEILILKQFSLLPAGSIQNSELVQLLGIEDNAKSSFTASIKRLSKKGWLKRMKDETSEASYSMHPLIQDMVLYQHPAKPEDVKGLVHNVGNLTYWKTDESMLDRLRHIPLAERLVERLTFEPDSASIDFLKNFASILSNLGILFAVEGNLKKAEIAHKRALDIRESFEKLGLGVTDLSNSYQNISALYLQKKRYDLAEPVIKEAIRLRTIAFNKDPTKAKELAHSYNNLAGVFHSTGRKIEAKDAYCDAMTTLLFSGNFSLKEDLPLVATIRFNLARLFNDYGDLKRAERSYRQALKHYRDLLKINKCAYLHNLAGVLNFLGRIYFSSGRLKLAGEAFSEAIEYWRELVQEFPGQFSYDLAVALYHQGKISLDTSSAKAAFNDIAEAISILENRQLCPQDDLSLDISNAYAFLAHYYLTIKDFIKSAKSFKIAIKHYRDAEQDAPHSREHLSSLLNNYGIVAVQGELSEGLDALREAIIVREQLAEEAPERFTPILINAYENYIYALKKMGRSSDANGPIVKVENLTRRFGIK